MVGGRGGTSDGKGVPCHQLAGTLLSPARCWFTNLAQAPARMRPTLAIMPREGKMSLASCILHTSSAKLLWEGREVGEGRWGKGRVRGRARVTERIKQEGGEEGREWVKVIHCATHACMR